jgi:glutathione S-transferase
MRELILHHYPQSPISEKVRVAFGIKGLDWRSVLIPRIPPKPNLMPLTGGYRQTPVMQIGADVYCDSQCIIRELDRLHPEPTLFPGGAHGLAWGVGQWADGPLFKSVIAVSLVNMARNMSSEFLGDRGGLYFGEGFDLQELTAAYQENLVAIRAQFGWMNERLATRSFMLGAEPGLPDALAYYLIWFLKDRMADSAEFLNQFGDLLAWYDRVTAIGHGNPTVLSDLDALDIARNAEPQTQIQADPADPLGLAPGDKVTVIPENKSAEITGEIVALSADEIAIRRVDPDVGNICIHFPRIGYQVKKE